MRMYSDSMFPWDSVGGKLQFFFYHTTTYSKHIQTKKLKMDKSLLLPQNKKLISDHMGSKSFETSGLQIKGMYKI